MNNEQEEKQQAEREELEESSLLSHLVELRSRLMKAAAAVLVIFVGLVPFAQEVFTLVAQPLMSKLPEGTSMIATRVASPFLTPFKTAFWVAVFAAMPIVIYQVWAFVAPGLYKREKKLAMPLVLSSIMLFYSGAAFAYYVVFPLMFGFFTAATPEGVAMMTDIGEYLDFVLVLFFTFGIAFEVPIAILLLVGAGIVSPASLSRQRPYILLGAFALGMLLTPPDMISQTLLAVPLFLLYEIGILMARVLIKKREAKQE
ncbi:MAG: twin-arginine translocase subunit TatC [Gammaproteobacteria bacterium]|nr:twin-arginine translocase subunit TatC [Gammaproteobacteria bacterium]MCY4165880.1 twin-arginine translocase subunit TatC [Gammaproteobacteria bacterium]MCY4256184.1 twin-arginine translocase subunit TatC [Gammaproteobacteria bacterium]MCY4339987.1 twin-arginine translocase subunit TatC [Gammaproteobacteria bacterium]